MTLSLEKNAIQKAVANLRFRTQAFIDGKFVDSLSGKTYDSENPGTGKVLTQIARCDEKDVDRAVVGGRKTFDQGHWSRMSPANRKKILFDFADLIEKHAGELALLDALDAGKPIADCINIDLPDTVVTFRWHAEAIDKLNYEVTPTGQEHVALIIREPIGVVGAVIPWNFPLLMAAWKLAPALATGNSLILKPASQTSLSVLRLAELASEAGLPDGVLNVVPGPGGVVGRAIGLHKDVDAVAFTGSTEVGRLFLQYAAQSNLKHIMLECGGKSPQVVMDDYSDLDSAAQHIVNAAFWNMGENCSAGTRLIVHKDIKDALMQKVIAVCNTWPVGDQLDPATRVGPMIGKGQMDKVLEYIEAGKAEGAKIILGGNQVLKHTGGYFIELTIFDNVRNDMKIAREEIFGPVLATIVCHDEAEAIALANDTNYGLAASLYTDNVNRAHRMARALQAGTVSVNCYSEGDITTPFGGYKESGFVGRDKSIHAHDQYTQLKTIWMQLSK
jgi:gamma-glutamyl-gamma-aminobutyraldehyde dehydrogenase